MKKILLAIIALCALALGNTQAVSAANLNNFTVSDYRIHYVLGRDVENRSTLTTTESITAAFPSFDQNHGIERFIPKKYDGHPVNLEIQSVQNQAGQPWNYTTYDSGEYTVVRIGDANTYVHGEQSYVLTYTQHDVTKSFADTGRDEFYWDTNGTEWRVPIQNLSVDLETSVDVSGAMTSDNACYLGGFQSSANCDIEKTDSGLHVSAQNLQPGENITVAVGFQPNTFSPYKLSTFAKLLLGWFILQFALVFVAVILVG
ncbi:DUF2207 domain-containing protein [Candidatus Saccharibacteria bacterium]|nr:DUF2207 domain-containing protein [Candidatus Saccharibacteria bacterium]